MFSSTSRAAVGRGVAVSALAFAALASAAGPAEAAKDAKAKDKGQQSLPADAALSDDGSVRFAAPAGEATHGGAGGFEGTAPQPESAESIIGADGRVEVTTTTAYPARAVGLITRNGTHHCTGWLIGADTVLTAGHCVHSGAGGSFYSGLRFWPGRNGSSAPYGSCAPRSGGVTTFVGWSRDGDERHDAAVIKLSCSVGNTTGWFGFWWQSADLTYTSTQVQGYPGDKPQTQWRSNDYVRATEAYQVFYQNDTVGGMSGSPVWQNRSSSASFCQGVCGMAIHAQGLHGSGNHAANNHGTRITQAKSDLFVQVRNAA